MFKNIQQKLVMIFALIIIAIMMVLGTFLINNITIFYHTQFEEQMTSVFNKDLISQLETAAKAENAVDEIDVILDAFSGNIGTDSYRNYYILDGVTGADLNRNDSVEKTAVIAEAMTGKLSFQSEISNPKMEYAIPIPAKNAPKYIIYIYDTKNEMTDVIKNMLTMVLQSLLLGVLIATLLGIFLSRTITKIFYGRIYKAHKTQYNDHRKKNIFTYPNANIP